MSEAEKNQRISKISKQTNKRKRGQAMITKKQFVDIINHIKEVNDFVNKTNARAKRLYDSIISDFFNASSLSISFENDLVKVLENMFDTDLISWWLYELDYGRNFKIGYLIEADGITKPDLSTAEKLYDYLVENLKGENK